MEQLALALALERRHGPASGDVAAAIAVATEAHREHRVRATPEDANCVWWWWPPQQPQRHSRSLHCRTAAALHALAGRARPSCVRSHRRGVSGRPAPADPLASANGPRGRGRPSMSPQRVRRRMARARAAILSVCPPAGPHGWKNARQDHRTVPM